MPTSGGMTNRLSMIGEALMEQGKQVYDAEFVSDRTRYRNHVYEVYVVERETDTSFSVKVYATVYHDSNNYLLEDLESYEDAHKMAKLMVDKIQENKC